MITPFSPVLSLEPGRLPPLPPWSQRLWPGTCWRVFVPPLILQLRDILGSILAPPWFWRPEQMLSPLSLRQCTESTHNYFALTSACVFEKRNDVRVSLWPLKTAKFPRQTFVASQHTPDSWLLSQSSFIAVATRLSDLRSCGSWIWMKHCLGYSWKKSVGSNKLTGLRVQLSQLSRLRFEF